MNSNFKDLELYAKEHSIPIIEKDGLEILLQIVEQQNPKNILEVGTAIGYSALKMNSISNSNIVTFERDHKMIKEAKKNIQKAKKENKIKIIEEDFLEYDISKLEEFDLIYIDGAKSQYYNFFKKVESKLSKNGVIIFDNLLFHDFVFNEEKKKNASKNLKQLIRKLEDFIIKIEKEEGYEFTFERKGDGIGILKRSIIE